MTVETGSSAAGIQPLPCACATIRRAARAVTQYYGRAIRHSGLEITQFTLLQTLSMAGERSQGELAELLAIDSTTLTRTLAPLLKQGWVAARPGRDRRERLWRVAAKGEKVMQPALKSWKQAQDKVREALGQDGWKALMETMDRVTEVTHEGARVGKDEERSRS